MNVRQKIERAIVGQVVDDLLNWTDSLTVNNGDDDDEYTSIDKACIMEHLFECDDATLFLADGRFISFVYGNDGFDVIHDYSASLRPLLARAFALADRIESGNFEFAFPET